MHSKTGYGRLPTKPETYSTGKKDFIFNILLRIVIGQKLCLLPLCIAMNCNVFVLNLKAAGTMLTSELKQDCSFG
jgi:hypothetical protein